MRPTIYVAGCYSNGGKCTQERVGFNVEDAVYAGIALVEKGWAPFIPHLTHYVAQQVAERGLRPFTWREYMDWDDAFLARCDALLYLSPSKGSDIELYRAKYRKLTVYTSIEAVPDALLFSIG